MKAGVAATLNGEQALGLARARHGTENGDFTRSASQQKILIAIKDKISAGSYGVTDLINFMNILGDNIRTDLRSDTITAAAKAFIEVNFESIRQIPLIGTGTNYITTGYINGISYVYPVLGVGNYSAIQEYVQSSLKTNPIVVEDAKILVLNGSGTEGMAEKERDELLNSGFKVSRIGNAPAGNYFETIYVYNITGKSATAERLKTYYDTDILDEIYLPENIDTTGIDFVIILGVGYVV